MEYESRSVKSNPVNIKYNFKTQSWKGNLTTDKNQNTVIGPVAVTIIKGIKVVR